MAKTERVRQEIESQFSADDIARQKQQGWKLVAVEWERELPEEALDPAIPGDVPFGLQVADDAPPRLEENPMEREILFLMMELTVQDGPYSAIAEELNRCGYRTRQGGRWTPITVFQMLPRLIEAGPRIFATEEWQKRRAHIAKMG